MGKVTFHYLKTSLYVGINFVVAYIVARLLLKCYPRIFDGKFKLIILLIGTALLLIAGIGKLGLHSGIVTWTGETMPEKFNNTIFFILSHLGTFCIFLDLSLTLSEN